MKISALATAVAVISAIATMQPAHAELSCADFTRGVVLQDPDMLAQAGTIARPWFEASQKLTSQMNPTSATQDGGGNGSPNTLLSMVFMNQLAAECQALPQDTVNAIVATHVRTINRQLEAVTAKNREQQKITELQLRPSLNLQPHRAWTKNSDKDDTLVLTADQRGAITDHVRECWSGSPTGVGIDERRVLLNVTVDASGVARQATVAGDDLSRMEDPQFRTFAEKAVHAVTDPSCAKLPLPDNAQGKANVLIFRFSP